MKNYAIWYRTGGRGISMLFLLFLFAVGCGEPEWGGAVSGTVTFKGKPLPNGAVTFLGPGGRAANAEIEDGRYAIAKPPFGVCKISVATIPSAPIAGPVEGETTGPSQKKTGAYVPLPSHFWDPEKSGLTFTVTKTVQTHNIELIAK